MKFNRRPHADDRAHLVHECATHSCNNILCMEQISWCTLRGAGPHN